MAVARGTTKADAARFAAGCILAVVADGGSGSRRGSSAGGHGKAATDTSLAVTCAACFAAPLSCSCASPPSRRVPRLLLRRRPTISSSPTGGSSIRRRGSTRVRHVGIHGRAHRGDLRDAAAGHARHRRREPRRRAGFIDLHEHGQQDESYRMMVRDGVTTAFELEVGTGDVAAWYAGAEGRPDRQLRRGRRTHPGADEGAEGSRHTACSPPASAAAARPPTRRSPRWRRSCEKGLARGRRGRGPRQRLHARRADGRDPAHVQGGGRGQRLGAHPHARRHHRACTRPSPRPRQLARRCTSSTSTRWPATEIDQFLARIQAARDAGQDVTTEAYPYGAGMTEIQSALFDDWKTWPDEKFQLHQLVRTGERLTRKTFEQARKEGGTVIIHGRSDEQTRKAIVEPALDDCERRLHRERPRASAHLGQLRQDAREVRAGREGHDAHGRARAHDGHAGAAARSAGARHGDARGASPWAPTPT